jgi:hypothetical protein
VTETVRVDEEEEGHVFMYSKIFWLTDKAKNKKEKKKKNFHVF